MKIIKTLLFICAALVSAGCSIDYTNNAKTASVTNGNVWTDTDGNAIQAHDNIIRCGSKYYWYGMDYSHNLRSGDGTGFRAVKCYESDDLVNWTFKNSVLTASSSDLLYYADVNTPNVVYNASTGMYVMWMGYGTKATTDRSLVATSTTPYGNFNVVNSCFTVNDGAVITSLFKDSDNKCYLLCYALDKSADVTEMFIYALNNDYLSINTTDYTDGKVMTLFPTRQIGRANIVRHNGYYYMIMDDYGLTDSDNNGIANYSKAYYGFWTSGYAAYTGVRYAYAESLSGPWSGTTPFGPDNYTAQEFSSIITVSGTSDTAYLLAFNKWNSSDLSKSGYVWQPLTFTKKTETFDVPAFSAYSTVTIDASAGTATGSN